MEYKSPTWTEIARELYRSKKRIIVIFFSVTIIIAIATLFISNKYKASANLMPNPSRGVGFDIFTEEGGIKGLASSFLGMKSDEANRFYIILESRTVKKEMVEKFNLVNRYETSGSDDPIKDAISVLESNLNYEQKEEGNFVIEVWDTNPDTAKLMADHLITLLNERSAEVSTLEASKYTDFIESRYNKALAEFDSVSNAFKEFQKKYGVLELPVQLEQYFGIVATLSTEKYRAEIELDLLGESVSHSSSAYKSALLKYKTISKRLEAVYKDTLAGNLELNYAQIPELSHTYLKFVQEVEIQQEIQKFLIPIYEQAKMEEVKALPVVSIIDAPSVPIVKDKPKRSLIVLMAGASTLILYLLYTVLLLSIRKNRTLINSITK